MSGLLLGFESATFCSYSFHLSLFSSFSLSLLILVPCSPDISSPLLPLFLFPFYLYSSFFSSFPPLSSLLLLNVRITFCPDMRGACFLLSHRWHAHSRGYLSAWQDPSNIKRTASSSNTGLPSKTFLCNSSDIKGWWGKSQNLCWCHSFNLIQHGGLWGDRIWSWQLAL